MNTQKRRNGISWLAMSAAVAWPAALAGSAHGGECTGALAGDVLYATGDGPASVAIGDLDGDGDLDLAVANQFSDNVSILLNNADPPGTFAADVAYGAGDFPISVAIGDLDGDGDLDLAVANAHSDNVSILLNNGPGTFAAQVLYDAGDFPFSVAIGDLDGDGDPDLAVANAGSNNVSILLNQSDLPGADGTFSADVLYGTGVASASVAIGDLDGDGDGDLAVVGVVGGFSGNASILLNNGDGTFTAHVLYGTDFSPRSVAIGDLDGDGDPDLAVANVYGANSVSILRNNGDGTFAADVVYGVGEAPLSVAMGDLDSDGDLDLALSNSVSDNVSILLNNGDSTFGDGFFADVLYGAGDSPASVAIGDLDGDGHLDLAVANGAGDNVSILLNACDNQPSPGDITGDGIVDVDDLLLLLQAWGGCPSKGGCPADLAPADGDGEVNVDDLLILLQNWT